MRQQKFVGLPGRARTQPGATRQGTLKLKNGTTMSDSETRAVPPALTRSGRMPMPGAPGMGR